MQQIIFFPSLSLKTQYVSALDGHLQVSQYAKVTSSLVKTTPHATGGKSKQGANYRLQKKQNNGLMNVKSKLLQQTQVDDAPCEVKEFYEIKKF
jgi:hypothetical protein